MATNPHLSLDSAVKLLTSTMRDPIKASACAVRLGVAADCINLALEACTSTSAKIKLAKSYPELLRLGIRFLTFNQSPQDHVAMVGRLTKCRCNFGEAGMKQLHKPSRYRPDGRVQIDTVELLFDAVATVSECLVLALADLTQNKFRTGTTSTGEQRWPQGPTDLLPHGPKDTLAGLELWVAQAPFGYTVFKLAGSLAFFHVPFAKEVLQPPDFTFVLGRTIQHLEKAVEFYEGDNSPLSRIHFFPRPIMTIIEFLDNLSACDTCQFNIVIVARGDWISPVLARLTIILSTLPSEWSKTRRFIQHITAFATAEVDRKTGVSLIKFERNLLPELASFDGLENAFDTLVSARKMGCWNIACTSAPEGIHSRLCSKCNLIRFCGEKCQKEAWKCANLPHKSVCVKIYSLKESIGTEDWSLLWTPDFNYAKFQAMCSAKALDIAVVKAIGSTISSLRLRKNAFQEDTKKAASSQIERLKRAEQDKQAHQMAKDALDRSGEQYTEFSREESFNMMNRDAYF